MSRFRMNSFELLLHDEWIVLVRCCGFKLGFNVSLIFHCFPTASTVTTCSKRNYLKKLNILQRINRIWLSPFPCFVFQLFLVLVASQLRCQHEIHWDSFAFGTFSSDQCHPMLFYPAYLHNRLKESHCHVATNSSKLIRNRVISDFDRKLWVHRKFQLQKLSPRKNGWAKLKVASIK